MMNMPIIKKPALIAARTEPRLLPITSTMLPVLMGIFKEAERQDPYLLSPAYFAMTGRKGLWVYGDNETMMMLARHPNDPGKLLLFPPIGNDPARLLRSVMAEPNRPDGELQLARLGPEDVYLGIDLNGYGLSAPQTEDVLDWTYPVHVLDTASIQNRSGPKFRDFRQNVNRAFGRNTWSKPIGISNSAHIETVRHITEKWVSGREDYSHGDLVEPTEAALDLMRTGKLPMQGILTYEGAMPAGFIIWEETDPARGIANSITALSVGGKGADEFAMFKMCEHLQENGFREVCIGGSETPGLDAFKRKMNPVRSVSLSSARFGRETLKGPSHLTINRGSNQSGESNRATPMLRADN